MEVRRFGVLAAAVGGMLSMGSFAHGSLITESLLTGGTTTYSGNSTGTIFSLNVIQPAGSGVFNPFVRIQATPDEQGYNSISSSTLDDTSIGPGNPIIPLNSGVLTSTDHVQLQLDANEPGAKDKSTLELTNLILVISTNPNKVGAGTNPLSPQYPVPVDTGDVMVYDMKNTTDVATGNPFQILIDSNYNLATGNGGSGQSDLMVDIDLSHTNLAGLIDANHFLYVYSAFNDSSSGYEEWNIGKFSDGDTGGSGRTPEPASLGVLGLGLMGLAARRRRA